MHPWTDHDLLLGTLRVCTSAFHCLMNNEDMYVVIVLTNSGIIDSMLWLGALACTHLSLAVVCYGYGEFTTSTTTPALIHWGLYKIHNNIIHIKHQALTFFSKVDLLSKSISNAVISWCVIAITANSRNVHFNNILQGRIYHEAHACISCLWGKLLVHAELSKRGTYTVRIKNKAEVDIGEWWVFHGR